MLRVQGNADTGQFSSIKSQLQGMSPVHGGADCARAGPQPSHRDVGFTTRRTVNVEPPSTRFRTYSPSNFLRVSVPANWEQVNTGGGVTHAPDGGFVQGDGQTAFTHGVEVGVVEGEQEICSATRSNCCRTSPAAT